MTHKSRPTHNQICAEREIHIFEKLAPYFPMMLPHEQDTYRLIGQTYREIGEFPFASSGEWGRKMLEKYQATESSLRSKAGKGIVPR